MDGLNGNDAMMLQVAVDTVKAFSTMDAFAEQSARALSKPVTMEIKTKVELGEADKKIQTIRGELLGMQRDLGNVISGTKNLDEAIANTVEAIDQKLPGAGKKLGDALRAGGEDLVAATKQVAAEVERINQKANPQAAGMVRTVEAIMKRLTATQAAVATASGGDAGVVETVMQRMQKTLRRDQQMRELEKSQSDSAATGDGAGAKMTKAQRQANEAKKAQIEHVKEIKSFFKANDAALQELLDLSVGAFREAVDPHHPSFAKIEKERRAAKTVLGERLAAITGSTNVFSKENSNPRNTLEAFATSARVLDELGSRGIVPTSGGAAGAVGASVEALKAKRQRRVEDLAKRLNLSESAVESLLKEYAAAITYADREVKDNRTKLGRLHDEAAERAQLYATGREAQPERATQLAKTRDMLRGIRGGEVDGTPGAQEIDEKLQKIEGEIEQTKGVLADGEMAKVFSEAAALYKMLDEQLAHVAQTMGTGDMSGLEAIKSIEAIKTRFEGAMLDFNQLESLMAEIGRLGKDKAKLTERFTDLGREMLPKSAELHELIVASARARGPLGEAPGFSGGGGFLGGGVGGMGGGHVAFDPSAIEKLTESLQNLHVSFSPASIEHFVTQIQAAVDALELRPTLKPRIAESAIRALRETLAESLSSSITVNLTVKEGQKLAKAKIGADRTYLVDSINTILHEERFLARVGVDKLAFVESMREALAAAHEEQRAAQRPPIDLVVGESLHQSIAALLAGTKYQVVVEADRARLHASVMETMQELRAEIAKQPLPVTTTGGEIRRPVAANDPTSPGYEPNPANALGAKAAKAKRTREQARAEARAQSQEERDEERAEMIYRKGVRAQAKDPARAGEYLRGELSLHEAAKDAETIMRMYEKGIDLPTRTQRARAALPAMDRMHEHFARFEDGDADPVFKERAKVFGESFSAEFITRAQNRVKSLRDVGVGDPSKKKGALAGIDGLAWDEVAQKMAGDINKFSSMRFDFGLDALEGKWDKVNKATADYQNRARKFENDMLDLAHADTAEAKVAAEVQLKQSREEVRLAEERLKYRVLESMEGSVYAATHYSRGLVGAIQHIRPERAYAGAAGFLQQEFGSEFAVMNESRAGKGGLAFGDLKRAVFREDRTPEARGLVMEYMRLRGVSEDIVVNEQRRNQWLKMNLGAAREAHEVEQKLAEDVRRQVSMAERMKTYRAGTEGPMTSALKNGYMLATGGMLGFSVFNGLKESMAEYIKFKQELGNIQGMLPGRNAGDADNFGSAIAQSAVKYRMGFSETAEAAKRFAQEGMGAREVMQALDTTLKGSRALGLTIDQMTELSLAVDEVTKNNTRFNASIDWSAAVLDKVARLTNNYAVSSTSLAQAVKGIAPTIDEFSSNMDGLADTMDYSLGIATVLTEKLRLTGAQASNAAKSVFTHVTRPNVIKDLQKNYGVNLGNADTEDYLPVDQMLETLGRKFQSLNGEKQKQFATLVGGGRNNAAAVQTLLANWVEVRQVAMDANKAFGEADDRAQANMDTLGGSIQGLKTDWQAFTNNMLETSHVAEGLKLIFDAMGASLRGVLGSGGGTGTLLGLVVGGGMLAQGTKSAYKFAKMAQGAGLDNALDVSKAKFAEFAQLMTGYRRISKEVLDSATGLMTVETELVKAVGAGERLSGVFSGIADVIGPAGVVVAGLVAAVAMLGAMYALVKHIKSETDDGMGRYAVTLKHLARPGGGFDPSIAKAPQMLQYQEAALKTGFGTAENAQYYNLGMTGMAQMQGFDALYKKWEGMDEEHRKHFIEGNKKTLDKFREDFVKVYIEHLPDASKKAFEAMKTDGERAAEVIKLVGGAAWSATAAMQKAIEDLNASTKRMVDDTLNGLDRIKEAAANESMWSKALGLKGLYSKIDHTSQEEGSEFENRDPLAVERQRQLVRLRVPMELESLTKHRANDKGEEMGLPFFNILMQNPELRGIFQGTEKGRPGVLSNGTVDEIRRGQTVPYQKLLVDFLRIIDADPRLKDLASGAQLLATGKDGYKALARMSDATLDQLPMSKEQRRDIEFIKHMDSVQGNTAIMVKNAVAKTNPNATKLDDASGLLLPPINAAGIGVAGALQKAHEALIPFKDSILDLTLSVYEAVRRYRDEEQFARRYGQATDSGAGMVSLGRGLQGKLDDFRSQNETDIVKLLQDAATVGQRVFTVPKEENGTTDVAGKRNIELLGKTGTGRRIVDAATGRIIESGGEVGELRATGEKLLDPRRTNLDAVFGMSQEGQALKGKFVTQLKGVMDDAGLSPKDFVTSLLDLLQKLPKDLIQQGLAKQERRNDLLATLELEKDMVAKRLDLEQKGLPISADVADKMAQRAHAASEIYLQEVRSLDARRAEGVISEAEYQREVQKLDITKKVTDEYDAQVAVLDAQRALAEQTKSNFQGMLTGFKSVLTDTSIWDAVYHPQGDTVEQRARAKAQAIRDILYKTITPVFSTIYNRVLDNVFKQLVDKLLESKGIMAGMSKFENDMKGDIEGAKLMATAITTSGKSVADTIATSFMRAGDYVAGRLGMGDSPGTAVGGLPGAPGDAPSWVPGGGDMPSSGTDPFTPGGTAPGGTAPDGKGILGFLGVGVPFLGTGAFQEKKAQQDAAAKVLSEVHDGTVEAQKKKALRDSMLLAGGMIVGNVGGTMLGKGGQNAQAGSNIGTGLGTGAAMLLGTQWGAAGGPVGMAIGAAIGGLLGGFIGGKKDKPAIKDPVIKGLEAIERAQKETITAIQTQTDALLKPENRLMDLPSSFNVPQYAPAFGPGAGGGRRGVVNNMKVNLNFQGGVPANVNEVKRVVESALNDVLEKQRRNQNWD